MTARAMNRKQWRRSKNWATAPKIGFLRKSNRHDRRAFAADHRFFSM